LAHVERGGAAIRLTPPQVADELRHGEPGMVIPASPAGLLFSPQGVEPGDEAVVAERLKAVLHAA